MKKNINEYILSSESDDWEHPNIDKKSLINYKRQQKAIKKQIMQERLSVLSSMPSLSDEQQNEKRALEFKLSDKLVETSSRTIIGGGSNLSKWIEKYEDLSGDESGLSSDLSGDVKKERDDLSFNEISADMRTNSKEFVAKKQSEKEAERKKLDVPKLKICEKAETDFKREIVSHDIAMYKFYMNEPQHSVLNTTENNINISNTNNKCCNENIKKAYNNKCLSDNLENTKIEENSKNVHNIVKDKFLLEELEKIKINDIQVEQNVKTLFINEDNLSLTNMETGSNLSTISSYVSSSVDEQDELKNKEEGKDTIEDKSLKTENTLDPEEELIYNSITSLLNNNTLTHYISFLDTHKEIDLEYLENIVLYNLSENIKEGEDAVGKDLAKLSLYLKYTRKHGRDFIIRLNEAFKDKAKLSFFENECEDHYNCAKTMILEMNKK